MAIHALTQTIVHLTQSGRFRQAADREKEIGQIYLQEANDLRRACESYERAGDWYAQEDATAYGSIQVYLNFDCDYHIRTANACYKDAADLHADLDEYPQAIARYEQVADHSLTSALTKYSVKEYWLKAGLCALAMNVCRYRTGRDPSIDSAIIGYCNSETKYGQVWESGCNIHVNSRSEVCQSTH